MAGAGRSCRGAQPASPDDDRDGRGHRRGPVRRFRDGHPRAPAPAPSSPTRSPACSSSWSCGCSARWPWPTRRRGPSPTTPARLWATGPGSPSAGCTGTSGSSSSASRRSPARRCSTSGSDVPAVAAVAGPDAPDDGDEPLLGLLLRRVRVLVRRHQGRRHHRLPRAAARSSSSGSGPSASLDFSNLTAHGGFFPKGAGAIFSGIVVVIFSMVGAEIATIAAAESPRPRAGDRQGHQLGHHPDRDLLRRLDLPARGHPPLELHGARGLAVRLGLREDGHPGRRPTS